MTFVGITGILLSFLAFFWFSPRKDNSRLALFLVIAVLHVVAAYVYYSFVQTNDADTKLYFFDVYGFYEDDFALGTMAVVHITQWLKNAIGGTYFDFFLLYQMLGVWGIALVMRTLMEVAEELDMTPPPLVIALMFIPGMYFWTSAIGKDAPLFVACALAVWSSFRIRRRWFWFIVALGIMVLIRVHIAVITTGALTIAVMTGRGVPIVGRLILMVAAGGAAVYLYGTLQSELSVDLSSVGSIANYVDSQTAAATGGTDNTLRNTSFFFKLFSILYRPLFFDTNGLFGLVASFQNLVMIAITIVLIRNFRIWRELFRSSMPLRFATFHMLGIYLLLAYIYYNVGLGLRQREMATPALLITFGAVYMLGQLRGQATAPKVSARRIAAAA